MSVILPVHNGGHHFRDCLESLARYRSRDQFDELLVVDDESSDDAIRFAVECGARIIRVKSRKGPANARNVGAFAARGDILLFLDADVCIHPDTVSRVRKRFEVDPSLGAVFGAYDEKPEAPQLVSQFRNLLHCFVHQTSNQSASTFWSGCGAIRREVFLESGGFDIAYAIPCVEDIELGIRLVGKGVRIALDPLIRVNHLKRWTLCSMVVSDIRHRGIPWARLILRYRRMPNDLNLRHSSRLSVALTALLCLPPVLMASGSMTGAAIALALILAPILALNLSFYRFLAVRRGLGFAIASLPLHLIYFLCCGAAFGSAFAIHCSSLRPERTAPSEESATAESTTDLTPAMPAIGDTFAHSDLVATIESALLTLLPKSRWSNAGALDDSLRYALFPGGKRIRPLLTILGAQIFGARDERVLRAACAVEFVHASSLIIDDLPCMDDADLRRGNPTLHRVYGEEVALLAALALLNQAYALFGETPELIREAAECIGLSGMIGGQAVDLSQHCGKGSLEERDQKTSALTRLALTAGALAAGASCDEVAPLALAGQSLGRAYQICDDLLDVGLPSDLTGKTAKQDVRLNRPSHAAGLGHERRYREMEVLLEEARQALFKGYGSGKEVTVLSAFIDKVFAVHAQALRQAC